MFKSKLPISIISFLLGTVLIVIMAMSLSAKATQRKQRGDSFLLEGEFTQALESYKQAQRLWPILFYDSEINFWIERAEEATKKIQAANIFMEQSATDSEIQSLMEEVRTLDGVKEVKYISKEDAYNQFKELMKDDFDLVKLVSPNIIPASVSVRLDNLSLENKVIVVNLIINLIKSKPFVESVNFSR